MRRSWTDGGAIQAGAQRDYVGPEMIVCETIGAGQLRYNVSPCTRLRQSNLCARWTWGEADRRRRRERRARQASTVLVVGCIPIGQRRTRAVCLAEIGSGHVRAGGRVRPRRTWRAGRHVLRHDALSAGRERDVLHDLPEPLVKRSAGTLDSVEPVTPSVGWGVLHLYYRVDRERAERDPGAGEARASTRSPRSKPTVTRRSRWRCSVTRPISASSRSGPISRGCNASRTSCSPRRSSRSTRTCR